MDERAMSLVLESLRNLIPKIGQADAMFGVRLLETYPDVYRRFAMNVEPRDRSPVQTLLLLLGHMGRCGAMAPALTAPAPSRTVCRLIDAHHEALAETLIWTLRRSLGTAFTTEVERAWCRALEERFESMIVNEVHREGLVASIHADPPQPGPAPGRQVLTATPGASISDADRGSEFDAD